MRFLIGLVLAFIVAMPARAHHPGADLDKVMGSKEKYFQKIDKPAPAFELWNGTGKAVRLSDFADKIVVLHFVYTHCPDVCPLHAEKLVEVQKMVNASPMREIIKFITITTDPKNDTPEILATYGKDHGFDAANWMYLTTGSNQAEDTTRRLARDFGHRFLKGNDGYQTHGVVTHVIDRGGRWAGNFHGLRFAAVNMVLYLNGLINAHPEKRDEGGWLRKLRQLMN